MRGRVGYISWYEDIKEGAPSYNDIKCGCVKIEYSMQRRKPPGK